MLRQVEDVLLKTPDVARISAAPVRSSAGLSRRSRILGQSASAEASKTAQPLMRKKSFRISRHGCRSGDGDVHRFRAVAADMLVDLEGNPTLYCRSGSSATMRRCWRELAINEEMPTEKCMGS